MGQGQFLMLRQKEDFAIVRFSNQASMEDAMSLRIEQARLEIEQKRLAIEEKRLPVESERHEFEKERLNIERKRIEIETESLKVAKKANCIAHIALWISIVSAIFGAVIMSRL